MGHRLCQAFGQCDRSRSGCMSSGLWLAVATGRMADDEGGRIDARQGPGGKDGRVLPDIDRACSG